jgi:endonuclease VIII
MPEGDTIHHAARILRSVLEGCVPDEIRTPQPRHAVDRWPERLAGRPVHAVDAYGKHLFLRFDGDLVVHSHLGMTGAWTVNRSGQRWRRSPSRAWLVLRAGVSEVVQFGGPTLELLTAQRARTDPRLANLGPDILAERFDAPAAIRRLRGSDATRPVGDALLDQRALAGIGNIWKSESCFAAGVDPWREIGAMSDGELLDLLAFARENMEESARDGFSARPRAVYRRAGEPCVRCSGPVRSRGQGDQNRTTYWCPVCQT